MKGVCRSALRTLEDLGAQIVSISIPELELLRVAHTVTIASEMRQKMNVHYAEPEVRRGMNPDVEINLTVATNFKSHEYVQAQVSTDVQGLVMEAYVIVVHSNAYGNPFRKDL